MRLIHKVPFSAHEIETYRHLIFNNLTHGMKYILDAMEDMELKILEENIPHVDLIENANDIGDGEQFPTLYYEPLKSLWEDPNVQKAYQRGNEAALPDKSVARLPPVLCQLTRLVAASLIILPHWIVFSTQIMSQLHRILFMREHGPLASRRQLSNLVTARC
jgi:hypothetical protein